MSRNQYAGTWWPGWNYYYSSELLIISMINWNLLILLGVLTLPETATPPPVSYSKYNWNYWQMVSFQISYSKFHIQANTFITVNLCVSIRPQDATRMVSPSDSTRMFRPAGSKAITIHNLDLENNGGWKMSYYFADALCIGQDEQMRVMVDLWNYTEVGTGKMVSSYILQKWVRLARTRCRA